MTTILLSGCSYTKGIGLDLTCQDPDNAYNIFVKEYFKENYICDNVARGGNSNLNIFFDTNLALLKKHYDYTFVCWSSYPRYNFQVGFEPYDFDRRVIFTSRTMPTHYKGHNLSFSEKWFEDFKNKYMLVHHDHFEIINIMKYMSALELLAEKVGTKLYFVNNLGQWDEKFFDRLTDFLPSDLTQETKKTLDVDTRDDEDIYKLYNLMHDNFEANGGIREHKWLNLYSPFRYMKLDFGNDGWHPGPLSHKKFGAHLAQCFFNLNQTTNTK